jgi:YD repeat-containing protein
MLIVAALLLTLFNPGPARQQAEQTDREEQGLVGPVKTVSAERIDPADDSGSVKEPERRQPLDAVTFDERGREISRRIHSDYGFLIGTQTNTYDAAGRLAESSLKAEEKEYESREVYRYDSNSRLVEKLSYKAGGADPLKESFAYDARARVTEVALSYRGEEGGRTKYKYDEKGRLAEVSFYKRGGAPGVAPVGPCFGVHRLAYKYDARVRVAEVRAYEPDNSLKRTTTYDYDERGNVAKESRTNAYGTVTFEHAYDYDARGNWTKRGTRFVSKRSLSPVGIPTSDERTQVVRRTITYY